MVSFKTNNSLKVSLIFCYMPFTYGRKNKMIFLVSDHQIMHFRNNSKNNIYFFYLFLKNCNHYGYKW